MSLHNFNPNNKSWKMYTNTITSISGDDILIKPHPGKNLLLEVSGNNNIFFKKGDISYGLEDLIGGGNSNITLTSISGNIIPSIDNAFKLGDVSKNWSNAYIRDLSVSNISVSGNIIPYLNLSGSLGTATMRWSNAFINDLSIVTINGQAYGGAPNLTSVSTNIIPSSNNTYTLGDVGRNWSNAYITNISAINISISGNLTSDISNFRITTTHRLYQNICGDTSWNVINGYYGLAKNAFPALNPLISGAKAISTWTRRTVTNSIGASLSSIVWSSKRGMFVGGGMNGLVYSFNGITWTFTNPGYSTSTWVSVAWSNELNLFVAISPFASNNIIRSSLGTVGTWPVPESIDNSFLASICWSSERMLFVAVCSGGANRVRTSKNAINWNPVNVPLSSWSSVCWSPELMIFVAVASDGNQAMYSSDGSNNWITTNVETSAWRCVCWSPELGLFVALANVGTYRAMTSYNGKDWNRLIIQQNSYNSICWVSQLGLFIGTDGTGIIIYSQDGIVWTTGGSGSPAGLNGIAWSPELGVLASVGGQGAVMTSSLKGRPPTSYNVFDSPHNSIDELGKWTFLNTTTTTGFITDLSSLRIEVTNSVTPLTNNSGTLGSSTKYWRNAYIQDISVTNIEISGNMLPLRDISSDLGSSLKRWRNIYVNNLRAGSVDVSDNLNVSGNVVFGGSTLYTPASFIIDPAAHGNNTGLVQINGNLQVLGTTTTINSSVVDISDKMIVMASNSLNSAQADGGGFEISGANARFIYSDTSKTFNSSLGIGISGNLIPLTSGSLGLTGNMWTNAFIHDISVTNISVSENISANGVNVTSDQLAFVSGATSNIQTQLTDLSNNKAPLASPTFTGIVSGITKVMVDLSNVDNTSDALKPISTATQTALNLKANISVSGDISNVRQLIPQLISDISSSLGTTSNIWQKAFIRDISGVVSINGTTWPLTSGGGTSDFSATNISSDLIPSTTNTKDLGSIDKIWRYVYADDITINKINGQPYSQGGGTTSDTTLTIKNNIDLNQIHYDSNLYYKGQLTNKTSTISGIGKTLALSDDGRTIVIGSNKNGLANAIPEIYVYYFIENSWVQKGLSIKGTQGSYFGKKVAISGNGEVISISDINGNIYLYKWKYSTNNTYNTNPLIGAWTKLGATITREKGHGISMSLNYSGDKMACGSYLATTLLSDINNNYTNWQAYLIKNPTNTSDYGGGDRQVVCWNGSFFAAIIGSVATISYDGKYWSNLNRINSTKYVGICWNGSIFCAVGNSAIITSIDGLNWTSRTSPNNDWKDVCWGNNIFVAVSTNLIAVSSDGITWTSKTIPVTTDWRCITWGKDKFVVGGQGGFMTSSDGSDWTYILAPDSANMLIVGICWSGSIFCALSGSGTFRSLISSDGIIWNAYRISPINGQQKTFTHISWNGSVFCSIIPLGILYSYDGIYWVTLEDFTFPVVSNSSNYCSNLAWNGEVFVGIVFSRGESLVSPINFPNHVPHRTHNVTEISKWNINYNPLNNTFTSICFGNNIFVAISNTGITNNRVIVSYNGIDWYPSTSGVEKNNWISVTFGYDKFCAIANSGETNNRIMISYDGMKWQPISYTENFASLNTIVWGNGLFLIFSIPTSNAIMSSSDGINWTITRLDGLNFTSAVWGNNRFIAVTSEGATFRIHSSVAISQRQPGMSWTNVTTPALNNWTSVCWGNNIFLAVASSGTGNRIMRSTDGTTWTLVTSPADSGWSSVTFGNNRFVAVATTGTVKIMYSTDNTGSSWVGLSSFVSTNSFTSITFGNGIFCAVANSGLSNTRTITSSDGITWNSTNSQILTSNWNSICWNGSIFCAVASSDISNVRVKISSDGTVWSSSINGVLNNSWRSICWNGSIFCAVASTGNTNQRVMISVDGLIWTNATSGVLNNSWTAICWNGTIFCAIANSGNQNERVMTSSNGLNWTNATSGVLNSSWTSICWNGYIFCAVASSGNTNQRVMTSANGLVWNNAIAGVLDNSWNSVCWNGYIFCAVASSGTNRVMISNDGLNWTSYNMNLPDTYWSSICWNGNFFCAVANGGLGNRVATSYDGITWTSRTSIYENNNWNSICWNGSIFCAIASSGSSRAMTSSINYGKEYSYKIVDTWSNISTGTLNNNYTGIAFGYLYSVVITSDGSLNNQYLFTLGGNITNFSSVNVVITRKSWKSICVANDISFCAVADNATGNDCVLIMSTSDSNSASWLNAISGVVNSTWNSICWSGSIFCAVARSGATTNQQVMISSNGLIWQNAVSGVPASSWVSVCWGNNMFCAVANNGAQRVMTSLDGLTWTGRVSNPSDSNWTSITWGNNLFCAVANSGTLRVMISYDGITWTGIASNPSSNNWTSITWGNDIFCAVANNSTNSLMTSSDGISWTYDKDINNPWNYVCWHKFKNLFMVLSAKTGSSGCRYMVSLPNYGRFLYREKSIWYTQSLTANTSVSNLSSITWAGDRFCAIGTSFAITSIDNGNTWTRYSLGSGLTFTQIAYANEILLAVSGTSFIRSLNKGQTWSSVYTPSLTNNGGKLISANNIFFICSGIIIYSTNGIDFSLCTILIGASTIGYNITNIVWSPVLKIYIGNQDVLNRYFTSWSNDGITWYIGEESYYRARHLLGQNNVGPVDIAWSPKLNVFVVTRSSGGALALPDYFKSYDGKKWQHVVESCYNEVVYDLGGQGPNILWDGNNFISYSQYRLWSSSDGSNWIMREDISNSNFLSNVITITKLASDGNGKICGVGNVSGTRVIIRFSDNYGYDFPGVAFKNGNVRIYDIQDINYVPSSENNFGHREIGYFETANESEKTSLSVEMSSDGKTVVAGFPSSDSSGNSVKIYTYENNTWKSLANQIKDLSLNSNYNFGTSVATSANGSIIAVAAMSSNGSTNGYVKVYKAQNTYPKTYVQLGNTIETNFGTPITFYNSSAFDVSYQNNLLIDISFQNKCLALSANGYVLTVGNINDFNTKGSVKTYMYNTTNNSWNVIKDISGQNIGDRYGLEVHMPKYDYNTLAWSADPSNISTSVINYGYSGTITY